MVKYCFGCKTDRDLSCFKSNKTKSDGLQSQCISCQQAYRKKHYEKNKSKYVKKAADWKQNFLKWWREYKKQFVCSNCPETHSACIEFHHHNDDKEASVARLVQDASKQKVLKEIAKCTPLCSNCHKKLHWAEREKLRA
jgi:hypothetical protein